MGEIMHKGESYSKQMVVDSVPSLNSNNPMKNKALTAIMGFLADLDTTDKSSLVAAINELDADKTEKSDLASIKITGNTNTTSNIIKAGTYFYKDGVLVRAKNDISVGGTLTEGTNFNNASSGLNEVKQWIYLGEVTNASETGISVPNTANEVLVELSEFSSGYETSTVSGQYHVIPYSHYSVNTRQILYHDMNIDDSSKYTCFIYLCSVGKVTQYYNTRTHIIGGKARVWYR